LYVFAVAALLESCSVIVDGGSGGHGEGGSALG